MKNNQNPNPAGESTTISSEPEIERLAAAVDAAVAAETPDQAAAGAPAAGADDPNVVFLKTIAYQIADKGVDALKSAGFSSPGMPPLMTEEQWKTAVAETSVQVIQKRWPDIAKDTTPEFVLLALLLPWFLMNLPALTKLIKGMTSNGTGNSDTRSDGNRKDNENARTPGPVPEGVSDRSDAGHEV